MTSYHRCSKCNSDRMMDGVHVAGAQGPRVVVGVEHHPDRGRLTRSVSTGVHASVCGSCGFVELWANRPDELWDAYNKVDPSRGSAAPR